MTQELIGVELGLWNNLVRDKVKGFQLANLNFAGDLNGVQIALSTNIVFDLKGILIGSLNIIDND